MYSPLYRQYLDETIALVRSLVIKSEHTIEAQNKYIQAMGHVVGNDPRTWKYYLNLAGRYHATDTLMSVNSSDTAEVIPFTRESLEDHPLTRMDYSPGGIYYEELLAKYPTQRDLIPRITAPIDMEMAIEAPDFTILYHAPYLVASNEFSLMSELQQWLYSYRDRWHLSTFAVSDPLYPAAGLAILYHNLVPVIINLRLERARTAEVDSFHRWTYLGSRYRLDKYRQYLSNRQSLFLYRNIDYLKFHVGKERTLETLLTHICEPADIEGIRYNLTLDNEDISETLERVPILLDSPYKNDRISINILRRSPIEHGYLLTKEAARHNQEDMEVDIANASKKIKTAPIESIPTGLVQMRIRRPITERFANPEQIRITQWLYLVSLGKFKTQHTLIISGKSSVTVSAKEAAILLCYAVSQVNGTPLEKVPNIWLDHVHMAEPLTRQHVVNRLTPNLQTPDYIEGIIGDWVPHPLVHNAMEFTEYVDAVKERQYLHQILARRPHNTVYRSQLKALVRASYPPTIVRLAPEGTDYERWLTDIKFPYEEFELRDYYALVFNILETVPEINLDKNGTTRRQRAMVDIVRLLSSYGVIFVEEADLRPAITYHYGKVEPYDWLNRLSKHYHGYYGLYGYDVKNKVAVKSRLSGANTVLTSSGIRQISAKLSMGLSLKYIQTHNTLSTLEVASTTSGNVNHIRR